METQWSSAWSKCPHLLDLQEVPSVVRTLYRICKQVYKSKQIPEDWATAFVVLLQKSEILDKPEEFRPIAITNTAGKIFFSIISDRLQKFLVKNKFIKTSTQKGFFLFGSQAVLNIPSL